MGKQCSDTDLPPKRSVPVENTNTRKRARQGAGSNLESHANLSTEFSLESSRLLKRHNKYDAEKSKPRPWDLNSTEISQHYVNIENSLIQRERTSIPSSQNQRPALAEEPSGSA